MKLLIHLASKYQLAVTSAELVAQADSLTVTETYAQPAVLADSLQVRM